MKEKMELNDKEIKYIIELLEHRNYRINEAINKVKDRPWQYIDDISELNKEIEFVNVIINKLSNINE